MHLQHSFMDKIKILTQTALLRGLKEKETEDIIFYLNPVVRKYKKGNIILRAGGKVTEAGIILKGRAQIIKEDIRGNRAIIAELEESSLFAEALACAGAEQIPVSVIAESDAEVMFINFNKLMTAGSRTDIGVKLIKNMMALIARKNIFLNNKLEHVSKRTTREKLMSYFNELALKSGGRKFTLPFSKTALADYLFVDRSAMVRELGNMKKDGLINFYGINFIIKK